MIADASDDCMSYSFIPQFYAPRFNCAKTPTPCTEFTSSGLTYPLGTLPRPMLFLGAHKNVLSSFKFGRK